MDTISKIIDSHPTPPRANPQLASFVAELQNCAATCNTCADACLSEDDVRMLAKCIGLNADCADVCTTTARLAGRVGHHQHAVMRHQVEACQEICRLCAEECERHEHAHCKVCAESCRACEAMCGQMLERMMAVHGTMSM